MIEYFSEVNLITVLVATVLSMLLGMTWHSQALFGKEWMKLQAINAKAAQKAAGTAMVYGLVHTLVVVYLIGVLIYMAAPITLSEALIWGGVAWFAFAGHVLLNDVIWALKPKKLFVINAGYSLLMTELVVLCYWFMP